MSTPNPINIGKSAICIASVLRRYYVGGLRALRGRHVNHQALGFWRHPSGPKANATNRKDTPPTPRHRRPLGMWTTRCSMRIIPQATSNSVTVDTRRNTQPPWRGSCQRHAFSMTVARHPADAIRAFSSH